MANTSKKTNTNKAKDIDIEIDDTPVKANKSTSGKGKSTSNKSKSGSGKTKGAANTKEADLDIDVDAPNEVDGEVYIDSDKEESDDIADQRNKYLRLAAEYDNFRKRSAKERELTYAAARADTIAKLLPVYDNLERALKMECADEAFYKGVEMTMTQLLEIFESMDVKQIPAVGEPFDPNHHNAVMTIENPELGSKIVAEEFQKGFILGDKVIRHSTVVVAN